MNEKLYQYYEGMIVKTIQDLRNTCITAICVMVSDGVFNGPNGKPRDIFLHKDNQHLSLTEFTFNDDEQRVAVAETEVSITTYNEEGDDTKEDYTLATLPTEWLYEVYRYISRSF